MRLIPRFFKPYLKVIALETGNNGGISGKTGGFAESNKLFQYNAAANIWLEKASFKGEARQYAAAFSIEDKAYLVGGYGKSNVGLAEVWCYDGTMDTWIQKKDFPGGLRWGGFAFAIGVNGYFGCGTDTDTVHSDFWKYNPTTDTWSEIVGFGGNKRRDAASFTIGTNVYMGTGISNGSNHDDFWVFDTTTEVWTALGDLDDEDDDYDVRRNSAVGFSMNGLGYFATGSVAGASTSIWEYDPSSDVWEEKTDYEGATREDAIAFYNGIRAFVALGRTGSLYLDDNREFFPFEEEDEDD